MSDHDTNEKMTPEASPKSLSPSSGVRRANNRPIYILFAVMGAFLLIMMMVAADRAATQNTKTGETSTKTGNTSIYAKEIAEGHTEGMIQAAAPTILTELPPMTDIQQPVLIAKPTDLDVPPKPPQYSGNFSMHQQDDDAQRIHMAKLQMLEEAIKAKTGVQVIAPRSAGSSQKHQDRDARLAQVRQEIATAPTDSTGLDSNISASSMLINSVNRGNGHAQFDNKGGDRWQLNSKIEAPRTPYELRAGFILPATLISGINSDLPGQIMAQVSQHVYDTATGKYLLVPQGSRLIGSYSSEVSFGQARVLVAWQRIIFPDGKAMDIGSMPGADEAGYSGFHDKVNNHYWRIFASAFLMSGITAGIAYSQDKNENNSTEQKMTMSSAMSQALGQQLGQVTVQLIAKNLNVAPTLEIRPGYRFNVIVTKDMTFSKPYQQFDY